MIKVILIRSCRDCDKKHRIPSNPRLGLEGYWYCEEDAECRVCPEQGIPEWCPLPDIAPANNKK